MPSITATNSRRSRREATALGAICLTIGLAVTLAAYDRMRTADREAAEAAFRQETRERLLVIAANLREELEILQELSAFYAGSTSVTREDFAACARALLPDASSTRAVGWAPLVRDDHREQFADEVRRSGVSGFAITAGEVDQRSPAAPRAKYFPLLYVEPESARTALLGCDIGSTAAQSAALETAALKQAPAWLPTPDRHEENPNSGTVRMVYPVYEAKLTAPGATETPVLRGFLFGEFDPSLLFARVLATSRPCGAEFTLTDESGRRSWTWSDPLPGHVADDRSVPSDRDLTVRMSLPLSAGTWTASARPLPGWSAAAPRSRAGIHLAIGLLLSVVMAWYVRNLSLRREHTEQLVAARTRQVEEQEQRIRQILQALPVGMFIVDDRTHTIVEASPMVGRMCGVAPEKVIGAQLSAYLKLPHPALADRGPSAAPFTGEGQLHRPERDDLPVQYSVVRHELGERPALLIGFVDITAQKQSQAQLARAMEEAEAARLELLSQYRRLEQSRRTAVAMVEEAEAARAETELAMEALRASEAVLRDTNLRLRREQAALAEKTEALEKANADLAAANRRMTTLAEDAQAANAAKSAFLANMSHEIRTPMTAILGCADVIRESCPHFGNSGCACVRENIATIIRNAHHLLGIINDILDLSKIEAGKMPIKHEEFAPAGLAEEVIAMMRSRALAKNLPVMLELCWPLPARIRSDASRVRQVLINLVGNAIKFTEAGHVRVRVAEQVDDSGRGILFEVSDTGPGMSEAQIATLFTPFSQADESLTRRHGGTGLGLAISRRIAELLNARLDVASTVGAGSTIRFHLRACVPAGAPMQEKPIELSPPAPNAATASPSLPSCRVLVVEDGEDNQRLLRYFLQKAGAGVELADNGAAGVEKARQAEAAGEPFDVILMDIQMPVLDGLSATQALRHQGYRRPIVAVTAHAMASDREVCLQAGCDDYLTKPIDRAQLLATVRRYVQPGAELRIPDQAVC